MTGLERTCLAVMGLATLGLVVVLFAWLIVRHETRKPTSRAIQRMQDVQELELANRHIDLQRQRYTVLQYENEFLRCELQSAYDRINEQGATLALFQAVVQSAQRWQEARRAQTGKWRVV
jgi:hypothetical protein